MALKVDAENPVGFCALQNASAPEIPPMLPLLTVARNMILPLQSVDTVAALNVILPSASFANTPT